MLASAVEANYVHWHEIYRETHELTHVFMSHPEAVKLFRAYPHVVLIDSTYKTYTYNMALVEVGGVTHVGLLFFIACVLIPSESKEGCKWLLKKLMDILECTGASPSVFVTDRELGLIAALRTLFPDTPHLLCRWHLNRAIEIRAILIHKTVYYKDHLLKNPKTGWWNVINATPKEDFNNAWSVFSQKWKRLASYISRIWGEYATKFVLCYTNDYFHIGNTATSRVESAHSLLKAWLKISHLRLDTVWSRIHSMLEGQHSKIRKELEDSMSRPRITHRLFSLVQGKVSTKVIEIMEDGVKRGVALGIGLELGHGCFLRTTHGLPCACTLIYLKNKGSRVYLSDIHSFWRTLEYDNEEAMPKNDNDMFEELAIKRDKVIRRTERCSWRSCGTFFISKTRIYLHPLSEKTQRGAREVLQLETNLVLSTHRGSTPKLHSRGPPDEVPMPPIDPAWIIFREPSVKQLAALYKTNIDKCHSFMGTTPRAPRSRRDSDVEVARALVFDNSIDLSD
ncbi:hypothetical protein RND81_01G115400 [Saponaria officinalis]|uniref:MULE transposase domain-containing protein n=1 Tax=Saponaria officinalis TaxID=3572 RepID=A0AAW1NEG2_SAPOF